MSEIPEAAIEAAAKASWEILGGEDAWDYATLGQGLPYLLIAKVMLEAAAPYLIREAKEEAWFEGQYAARLGERIEVDMLNPYRITSVPAPAWRDVAAEALEEIAGRKSESYEAYSDRLESYFGSPAAIDAARSHPPTATYNRMPERIRDSFYHYGLYGRRAMLITGWRWWK